MGRAVDKAGLTASFQAHVNIVSLLTYFSYVMKRVCRSVKGQVHMVSLFTYV